jgi:hypothetical protein
MPRDRRAPPPSEDDLQPWDRQPRESEAAFAAFAAYRDQPAGGRSLRRLAAALSKQLTLLGRWSSANSWPERVAAFDQHEDRERVRLHLQQVLEMCDRHARMAQLFQQKVLDRMREILPAQLSPLELARWFELAVRAERQARGADGPQRVEVSGPAGGPLRTVLSHAVQVEINPDDIAAAVRALVESGGEHSPPNRG